MLTAPVFLLNIMTSLQVQQVSNKLMQLTPLFLSVVLLLGAHVWSKQSKDYLACCRKGENILGKPQKHFSEGNWDGLFIGYGLILHNFEEELGK